MYINIQRGYNTTERDLQNNDLETFKQLYSRKNYTGCLEHLACFKSINVTNTKSEIKYYLDYAAYGFTYLGHEVTFDGWTPEKLLKQNKTLKTLAKEYINGITDKQERKELTAALAKDKEYQREVSMVDFLVKGYKQGKVYNVDSQDKKEESSLRVNLFPTLKSAVDFLIKNYKIKLPKKTVTLTR